MLYKPKYESRKALIIGIDKYKNVSPLNYACSDATALAKVLKEKFSFEEEDIILLKDNEATKDKIIQAFHGFTQDKTDPDDKLLIFFAGHGHTVPGNRGEVGFLVPVDAKPNETSTLIRWDDLTRNAELVKAKHILFIMDACYGGLAITRKAPSVGSRRFLKNMCQRYSRQVIAAGKADETVADAGGPLPNHSIFTGHLLQGLNGAAAMENGIITANTIMSYVYEKVGNDPNSHQTPQYGYVEGGGDFIFTETPIEEIKLDSKEDEDLLIEVSSAVTDTISEGVFSEKVKLLVSDPHRKIVLHDMAMQEVRKFLGLTSKEKMPLDISFSREQLVERFKLYEDILENLIQFFCILAHWGDDEHKFLMEKIIKRLTDNNGIESGATILLNMRWYPVCILEYVAGISAMAGNRYDNLLSLMTTQVDCRLDSFEKRNVVVPLSDAMSELHDTFKIFPGHERNLVPRSEYLFKLLQPQLEEILFLGKSYESLFDRFEMFMALVYADITESEFGPVGRFGYKHGRSRDNLFINLSKEAESQKDGWPPIKAGLFGYSYERFEKSYNAILELMKGMHWF
ncbi:MAG: caspase family protein [Phycisphaerales bacterium]